MCRASCKKTYKSVTHQQRVGEQTRLSTWPDVNVLRSSSSCLCFLLRLPFLSSRPSVTCFRKHFPRKVCLPNLSFLCSVLRLLFPPCHCATLYCHTIGPADLSQPSQAQHFRTCQEFLIFFLHYPSVSSIQIRNSSVAFYQFLP
jgi:hypothetical protein